MVDCCNIVLIYKECKNEVEIIQIGQFLDTLILPVHVAHFGSHFSVMIVHGQCLMLKCLNCDQLKLAHIHTYIHIYIYN